MPPNPNYTVAAEVAELVAQGAYPIPHARQRMKDLGLDDETIDTLLAGAIEGRQPPLAGRHVSELEKACRTLLLAWDTSNPDPARALDAMEPSITLIRNLIGEPPR